MSQRLQTFCDITADKISYAANKKPRGGVPSSSVGLSGYTDALTPTFPHRATPFDVHASDTDVKLRDTFRYSVLGPSLRIPGRFGYFEIPQSR
jgi:hypothetical protein